MRATTKRPGLYQIQIAGGKRPEHGGRYVTSVYRGNGQPVCCLVPAGWGYQMPTIEQAYDLIK